jgi:DegV family protein with EDD domain
MPNILILTDSSVQFLHPSFLGKNLVRTIPLSIELRGKVYEDIRPADLPPFADEELRPRVVPPTLEKLWDQLKSTSENGTSILAVLSSASLCTCYEQVKKAADDLKGRYEIEVIDSQTISVGLGIVVQAAADAISKGEKIDTVEKKVRGMIPRIYSTFCIPGLSYLYYSGCMDQAQALVGEMLNLLPMFTLEEGLLSPVEKVRSHRQVIDLFQEFLEEFDQLQQIAFIQNSMNISSESRLIKDRAQNSFPKTPFTEHALNPVLATLWGPRSQGLFVLESADNKGNLKERMR